MRARRRAGRASLVLGVALVVLWGASLVACGDDGEVAAGAMSEPGGGRQPEAVGGATTSAVHPEQGAPGWVEGGVVDSRAMAAWMRGGYYRRWESSQGVAPSPQGPSRVYLSGALARSLEAGARRHPVGAIGVREIYEEDFMTLKAVNVLVKMDEGDAPDGTSWLWVELVDLGPGGEPSVEEPGAARCVACHAASGGADFIQSGWPLR